MSCCHKAKRQAKWSATHTHTGTPSLIQSETKPQSRPKLIENQLKAITTLHSLTVTVTVTVTRTGFMSVSNAGWQLWLACCNSCECSGSCSCNIKCPFACNSKCFTFAATLTLRTLLHALVFCNFCSIQNYANICRQSCGRGGTGANSTVTAAPRWPQLKLAQMTLYANIFKISLLFGALFLLPTVQTTSAAPPAPSLAAPAHTAGGVCFDYANLVRKKNNNTRGGGGNKILHINIIKYAMMNFIERITIVISLSGMLPMPSSPKYSL